jgi:hypothetical protein
MLHWMSAQVALESSNKWKAIKCCECVLFWKFSGEEIAFYSASVPPDDWQSSKGHVVDSYKMSRCKRLRGIVFTLLGSFRGAGHFRNAKTV